MKKSLSFFAVCILIAIGTVGTLFSQSSTGNISGTVFDEGEAVIAGAEVTIKNPATGFSLAATTNSDGRYRFVNIPTGTYEVTVGASNFSTYFQKGITLDSNQSAVVDTTLKAGNVQEVVTVTENASGLNTTTAEVSTRFDSRRLAELPISPNGSVFNVLLSVPGVSQLGPNQTSFAMGISFSSNGGRIRSNNFLLDGQDVSDPVLSGVQIPLNNPEALAEVRIITNQFLAEYGHNSGSVVNFIGKSGTNDYNGSAFVFFNGENFNACSNLNRAAGFCDPRAATKLLQNAPPRKELRYGFTFGGPLTFPWFGNGGGPVIWKGTDKTFFFGDYLRWTPMFAGSADAQTRRYDNSSRYGKVYKKPNFYDRHRNLINIGIGTGAGALLGGLIGGKKGALIGTAIGAGGSALYTYKLNPKTRKYYRVYR